MKIIVKDTRSVPAFLPYFSSSGLDFRISMTRLI